MTLRFKKFPRTVVLIVICLTAFETRAQWSESFSFGIGMCKLNLNGSPELRNKSSAYFNPVLGLGLEYKFKVPVSVSINPSYSYLKLNELYNRPYYVWGPFSTSYRYFFEIHGVNAPVLVNYHTHADDEKSWVFSAGAGISFMAGFTAKAQSTTFYWAVTNYRDTVYNVTELSPGNINTAVMGSITKKFKTKKSIKPYLRISYLTYTYPWQFTAINARTGIFFMKPHFINLSLGFTIKNQVVRRLPADQTILQESK